MKVHLALLAGLLISTSASADVLATYTRQLPNSDVLTVSITDEKSSYPYCKGKEARAVTSSGGMEFKFARGCWSVPAKNFIAVEMYAYSDGREIAFPIKMDELKPTPEFDAMLNSPEPVAGVKVAPQITNTGSIQTEKPSLTDVFAAGSCVMVQQAMDDAKTKDEKAFAARLRASLAAGLKLKDEELNSYCFDMLAATKAIADAEEKSLQ